MIATTVNMGKALLRHGISQETSDMVWIRGAYDRNTHLYPRDNFADASAVLAMPTNIPAWSLQRLMTLVPDVIDERKNVKLLRMTRFVEEETGRSQYAAWFEDFEGNSHREVNGDSLVECLVEMILNHF